MLAKASAGLSHDVCSAVEVHKELEDLKHRHADTQKTLEALIDMLRGRREHSSVPAGSPA